MLLKQQIIPKLKRYFLYISGALFVVTFAHLLYAYFYVDAKDIPMKWGTISEAIIWDSPHLNPLVSSSGYNKYINSILYRSLLKYDTTQGKFVPDIASCDIKNLQFIECFLQNNIKWSDGSDITTKDIVGTINLLKNSDVNPVIASLLSETTIEEKDNSIIFKNGKADINFLNVFFQPIVSSKVLNQIGENELSGKFPTDTALYSGKYKVDSIGQDDNLGIRKITLAKNDGAGEQGVYIDKIIFKVFPDISHFLKHQDAVNIFNDKDNVLADTMPRLSSNQYTLPQYVSFFINEDKVPELWLRNFILHQVNRDNIVKNLSEKNYKPVYNPFMSGEKIDKETNNKNIEQIIQSRGFYKKSYLMKMLMKWGETPVSWETKGDQKKKTETATPSLEDVSSEKSQTIVEPSISKVNFISQDDILLKGIVTEPWVEGVYVNDYKLKGFATGDKKFYYRLKKQGYDTIVEGKNIYQISFVKGGKKEIKESLVFFYEPDTKKLEEDKQKFLASISRNTVQKKIQIDDAKKMQLDTLDDTSYYDKNLQKLTLNMYYTDNDVSIATTANNIKESLGQYGIDIELQAVSLSDMWEILKNGNKNYDLFLAWINLGYFDYNLFPYLHSSQIKSGFNLSKIKKLSLDILLEEGRSNSLSQDKIGELETKILAILKDEQVMKTLYTPIMRNLVDKNIKNYALKEYLFDDALRFQSLESSYVSEKKIINFSSKSLSWFFSFLKSTLFY